MRVYPKSKFYLKNPGITWPDGHLKGALILQVKLFSLTNDTNFLKTARIRTPCATTATAIPTGIFEFDSRE